MPTPSPGSPSPAADAAAAAAAAGTGPLLRAFLFDGLVAVVLVFGLGVLATMAWMTGHAVFLAGEGGHDADAIRAAIGQPGPLAQVAAVLLASSTAAIVLFVWRRPADATERAASWAALRRGATWGWVLLVALAVFLGSAASGAIARALGIEPVPTNLALVESLAGQWPLLLVLFVVVLAPAYEELLFRRIFFGRFLAAGRPWLGLVVTSFAFALIHELPGASANPPEAVAYLWLVYGGMGAAYAWLYWRTGTLWAPILAHGLNNALALAIHGLT